MSRKKKASGISTGAVGLMLAVGLLSAVGGKSRSPAKPTPTTPTKETVAVATKAPTEAPTDAVTEAATEALAQTVAPTEWRGWEKDYPVNLNSGVFHNPGAGCIRNSTNIKIVHGTTEDLKDMGYRPCGRCF